MKAAKLVTTDSRKPLICFEETPMLAGVGDELAEVVVLVPFCVNWVLALANPMLPSWIL